jgi:hypothetical protein
MSQGKPALAAIDCCEANRPTSGSGLHVGIPLKNPMPITSRKQYGQINRRALERIDEMHDLPFKLADKVDQVALYRGILWMYANEMNDRSFELVSEATGTLDRGDWTPGDAE